MARKRVKIVKPKKPRGSVKKKKRERPRLKGSKEDISFTGRSRIIITYGPKKADRVVEKVNDIARAYAEGKLSKKEYIERVKKELKKAGLSDKEWKTIYEKIKEKNQA